MNQPFQGPFLAPPKPIEPSTRPPFAFYLAKVPPKERPALVDEIAALVAEDWQTKYDAAIEALGLQKPPPAERLRVYETQFDDARWATLRATFPYDWQELMQDYENLKARRANGDLQPG